MAAPSKAPSMEINSEKRTLIQNCNTKFTEFMQKIKKNGEDDPRRITHSIKVGVALTLVSLFYYFRPLYDGFGQAGMWAILTVVVVFEFTVGGTLSKCINRGCATLVAGTLGVGAEYLASLCGEKGEPIVLGLLVFVLAAASTFTRFIPIVKKRYDYGVVIFILTFSLVAVSGSRVDEILQIAHQRLSTILIGGATCMIISVFVCPVWAGQDLHNLVAGNIEKLAASLQGFGSEFCCESGRGSSKDESFLQGHKSVLNSKATEENLANFAWWEPGHGRFKFHHPWNQYLKIGNLARECARQIEALNGCLNTRTPHDQVASERQVKIRSTCTKISTESAKALKELSRAMKSINADQLLAAQIHLRSSKTAANDLKNVLENSSASTAKVVLQEIMPLLVVAHLLIDLVGCMDKIFVSVDGLFQKACFGEVKSTGKQQQQTVRRGAVKPLDDTKLVVVEISEGLAVQREIETVDDYRVVVIEITNNVSPETGQLKG